MKRNIFVLLFIIVSAPGAYNQSLPPENMVLIEGGTFMMGKDLNGDHSPAHLVEVNSFYMDIHEVTNAEYQLFCKATQNNLPEYWSIEKYKSGPSFPDYPVVGISNEDARRFAEWAGKRLPTEAEWEYAARGGLEGQNYPNGSSLDTEQARVNNPIFEPGPLPVMSFAPNGYGLYDMAGNVWEWVSDWYAADYYSSSPEANPCGPSTGRFKVIRGGGWHSGPGCNMVFYRNALPQHWVDIGGGFRCVRSLEAGSQELLQEELRKF